MPDFSLLADLEYWRSLCPDLHVSDSQPIPEVETPPLRDRDWQMCQEVMREDGYFAYDSWFDSSLMDRLADCFLKLKQNDLLPAFCFVYDEFWQLLRSLDPMMTDLLGDYLMLPAVWGWHVSVSDQTGFSPHRDQVRDVGTEDEEHMDYLTIWIPLTDLNHLSSCISLLPASLDPDFDEGTSRVRVEDLQDIRTLQGSRGSVFCWSTALIHWGTKQSRFGPPRMSVGYYVQRKGVEVLVPPPLDFSSKISFRDRLRIIGKQIYDYSREDTPEIRKLSNWLCDQ